MFTALIYSKDEALAMPPPKRPMCYRVPYKIYHDTFQAVGAASMCWSPLPSTQVFDSNGASKVAVELLFQIATQLELAGMTYENWPADWKGESDQVSRQAVGD